VVSGASLWSGRAGAQADAPPPTAQQTPPTLPTDAAGAPAGAPPAVASTPTAAPAAAASTPAAVPEAAAPAAPGEPAPGSAPFAWADWGWMNGQSREIETPLAGKVFNPQFTIDVGYNYEFSNPIDHTIVGSTSSGRSNELQIMHLGLGTELNYKGARGKLTTQLGLYSTMTPRNDASPDRGQWNLRDAYRYITEGYGGYHWDVDSGINVDAGIFLSYVGLSSYYNYENWIDQSSYVSSNTPWFFNGIRIQYFPTPKFKIEPWIINGWQSYGEFNEMPGLGFQLAYRPTSSLAMVGSGYYGKDTMGNSPRNRFHSDNSILFKYFDNTSSSISKGAISFTFDLGCENGGGVKCAGGDMTTPSQYFLAAMLYNRLWFDNNRYALTVGGGVITNPGRYIVLTPPINGATAYTYSPYFTQNPGDKFKAWDTTNSFDYMPTEFVTFRAEFVHRWADVPYFAGHGGVTPPVPDAMGNPTNIHTNQGSPGSMVPGNWKPDLVQNENRITFNLMVRM
jgi:hypothetical protein